jgi:sulfur relay (sulfurtransferase) complex TusBCD TusD component (DsrE family)
LHPIMRAGQRGQPSMGISIRLEGTHTFLGASAVFESHSAAGIESSDSFFYSILCLDYSIRKDVKVEFCKALIGERGILNKATACRHGDSSLIVLPSS